MTGRTLALRSLRYHWRAHLGVLLGAMVAAAILIGALAVGDSVRYSLRQMALSRLGQTHLALPGKSRFFRAQLGQELSGELNAPTAAIILLPGTVAAPGGEARANGVQVVGVTQEFWKLAPPADGVRNETTPTPNTQHLTPNTESGVLLNERLAQTLKVKIGEEVILRVDKPSLLSRDAPLSTVEDASVTLRLPVTGIVTDAEFGRFSLEANQIPPLNAFVPLERLQRAVGMEGRANTLLVGGRRGKPLASSEATQALWKHWQLTDANLELRELPQTGMLELRTDSVFLPPPVGEAALKALPEAKGVLTYFVNELRVGSRSTPYSTVTAMGGGIVPPDIRRNEILINQWLADDLQAKVGDTLTLKYWLVGPMRRLILQEHPFRIRAILPMNGPAADPTLMPNIPGLADKKKLPRLGSGRSH